MFTMQKFTYLFAGWAGFYVVLLMLIAKDQTLIDEEKESYKGSCFCLFVITVVISFPLLHWLGRYIYLVLTAVYCVYITFEACDVLDIFMGMIDSPYYTRKPLRTVTGSLKVYASQQYVLQQQESPKNRWNNFPLGTFQFFHGTDTLQAALDIYYNQRFKIRPERHYTGLYMTKVIEKAVFYATYENVNSPGYILILDVVGLSNFFISSDQISSNYQYPDWVLRNGAGGDSMSRFVLSLGKRVVDNGWEKILVAPVVQGSQYVKVEGLSVVAVYDTKRNFII